MISLGARGPSARTISSTSGAILPASLRAGTTTEMRGVAALDGKGLPSVIKWIRFCRSVGSAPLNDLSPACRGNHVWHRGAQFLSPLALGRLRPSSRGYGEGWGEG